MASGHASEWPEVSALFDRILAAPPDQRETLLRASGAPVQVLAKVRAMVLALDSDPDFLSVPPQLGAQAATDVSGYSSLDSGAQVGVFIVDRLIGRGGMGEVYLAHRADAAFEQRVALKMLRPEAIGRLQQFENERRILAGLEHPGIARLIDGGVALDGRPFMAMEYVEGQDIVSHANENKLGLRARLDLFRQACEAVDFAHRNLVVHRDLKPANILVDAQSRVRLLDFGIARLLDDGGLATQALLTPEYAAPEQFDGGKITLATDVFALGVVLYELLAGVRPWTLSALPLPSALKRRFDVQPVAPSAASAAAGAPVDKASVRGDLDAIALKALRREPEQRYQGAALLWRDIERHLRREPVQARGDARGYRLRRFASRHGLALAAGTAVFLALSAGLAGTAWQARQAAIERDQVLAEIGRVQAVKDYLLLMFRTAGENAGDQSTTAKQVLDQSARRLAAQYRDQPATHAELVETLGSLYLYMNDYDGVLPLLRGYLEAPTSDPVARADIGVLLADAELHRGNIAAARKALDAAQAFWNADPVRHRKALVSSRQLQAQIEKEESGLPRSLLTLQAALIEHDDYFGRQNSETANLLNSLGIAYQASGEIDKADAAFRDSWAVHVANKNVHSPAALLTLGNWATVAYRKNDFKRAEALLLRATSLRSQLYGPSAALAAMQANLGKIILRAGRPKDSLAKLEPALAMSRQYTGDHSTLTVAILQSLVEARLQTGDKALARKTLDEATAGARANSGEEQVLYAFCMGLEARWHVANGELSAAREFAGQMAAKIGALGDAGRPYAPEVEKLRAEIAAAEHSARG